MLGMVLPRDVTRGILATRHITCSYISLQLRKLTQDTIFAGLLSFPLTMASPHPLSALSSRETNLARDIVKSVHPGSLLYFRQSYLFEPPKAEVLKFLELEHSGALHTTSPRPDRCAQVFYDIIGGDQKTQYYESVVDLTKRSIVEQEVVTPEHQASLTM
jgi:Cu2+-containing amine oxidase